MLKAERVAHIQETLERLYPETPVPLDHRDPYTLLVAVLLSAQCTDVRVNEITPLLFAKADNPHDMVKLSVEEIHAIIRPCGLGPMKSKGIAGLSRILVEQYDGEVPADMAALEALPAVGHKTASVVMSQAFGVPAFPVDTHIHRLAQRWGLSSGKKRRTDREGFKTPLPPRKMERPAFTDYLLWSRILHRPRLRRHRLPALPRALPPAQKTGRHPQIGRATCSTRACA